MPGHVFGRKRAEKKNNLEDRVNSAAIRNSELVGEPRSKAPLMFSCLMGGTGLGGLCRFCAFRIFD